MSDLHTIEYKRRPKQMLGLAALALALALASDTVEGQRVEIRPHAVLPGGTVQVPVLISNAPVLASAAFQINFDSQLLTLTSVTNGDLGRTFSLAYKFGEGNVRIAAVRSAALTNVGGALVVLNFQANSGAPPAASSAIALANRSLSGTFGEDLEWANTVAQTNGSVTIVSLLQDSDGNGLPDWWEEAYFGAPTGTNPTADPDGDGMSNVQEYRAGTDPTNPDSLLRIVGIIPKPTGTILRHTTSAGRIYQVEYSNNLHDWTRLPQMLVGDGNTAEVQLNEPTTAKTRFYRVVISPP